MSVIKSLRSLADKIGLSYVSFLIRREYEAQQFVAINERAVELQFLFRHLVRLCPTTVLDVGTGATALPHLLRTCGHVVTAIDNIRDYWPSGMVNRHYYVLNDDITRTRLGRTFDLITCVSVLEHIKDHGAAMRSMFSLLRPGGHLVVTFPYNEGRYVPNVYDLPASTVTDKPPFSTQAFSRTEVNRWLEEGAGVLLEQEFWQFFTGEYWTCGERICPPRQVSSRERHQISCCLFRKEG